MFNVLVKWKFQLVSWARLQSIKLFLDLRMSLRANEIAFKFHGEGQIMAGIKVFCFCCWFSNATSQHILP